MTTTLDNAAAFARGMSAGADPDDAHDRDFLEATIRGFERAGMAPHPDAALFWKDVRRHLFGTEDDR